jgi:peptidyl-prolyl cis-trans isomerase SurA
MRKEEGRRVKAAGSGRGCGSLLLGVFVATCPLFLPGALAGPADRIAAVVGDYAVLESEVVQAMTFVRLSTYDTLTPDSALRRTVLDRLIDDQLLQEQARQESIDVDRAVVESDARDNVAEVRARFDTEVDFQMALAAEGLTERTLLQKYEDEVRRRTLAQKLMEKAGLTQAYISPSEAERFYNENRDSIALQPGRVALAHVLAAVRPSDDAEQAGQQRISEVLNLLATGGEFPALARSFSEDARTAAAGGDWGWTGADSLPPGFQMLLDQLGPGQVSPPFRTQNGYVVVKLDGKTGAGQPVARYRFRTILVRVPVTGADSIRARQRAESVRRQALTGVPFDTLARRHSDDPGTAPDGGRLGELPLDALTPPFDSVVLGLDSGDVSEPVLSEHGYHVLKVLAKQEARTLSYLEMQDRIRSYLQQQRFAERLQEYLGRIARKVYVQRYE